MKKHKRTGRHGFTAFIYLDSHKCRACWKCIETCPRGVIGKIDMLFHKHARVADPTRCKGCLKCVKACPQQAISALRKGDNRLHEVVI